MNNMQQWDIWEADVPFRENPQKSKLRPVLIVSPTEVLVLKMTSHGHSDKPKPYEYEIYKWKEAGLTVRTYVECDSFIRLGLQRFSGKYYGRLMAVDIIGVQQMMKYHGLLI